MMSDNDMHRQWRLDQIEADVAAGRITARLGYYRAVAEGLIPPGAEGWRRFSPEPTLH
jgi:hypothetical protein